jgi:hypothetical protein
MNIKEGYCNVYLTSGRFYTLTSDEDIVGFTDWFFKRDGVLLSLERLVACSEETIVLRDVA